MTFLAGVFTTFELVLARTHIDFASENFVVPHGDFRAVYKML